MGMIRIRTQESTKSLKEDRYLSKDIKNINKKYKKLLICQSIILLSLIILNVYQYLS